LDCPCLFPRLAEDGKKNGSEDSDNRYDNQELDQGEAFSSQCSSSFVLFFRK
jgi:hypothetical protein